MRTTAHVPADDARRFHDIFDAHHERVLAFALRRTPTRADAEDAAAETFTVAWRRLGDVPDEALPWLFGVARRVIANQRRGRSRRAALGLRLFRRDRVEDERFGEAEGPAIAALSRLGEQDQELLRLVAWEELTHTQIATVLGISVNAVAIRIHRARKRFADTLAEPEDVKGPGISRTSGQATGTMPDGAGQEDVR